jgi:acetolactate synthase, large subunit (EC 2.2.1.6)
MSKEQARTAPEADEESTTGDIETGADAVVRALENAGVEHLFGVQGGAIMPVYDSLYYSDMTHVTMAHEQGPHTPPTPTGSSPATRASVWRLRGRERRTW